MTQEEILEGNRLLADALKMDYQKPNTPIINKLDEMYIFDYRNNPIEFNQNWNLLMQAVEKINKMGVDNFGEPNFVIHSDQSFIYDGDTVEHFIKYVPENGKLIDAVFFTAVEFIKWLNDKKYGFKFH